MGIAILPTNDEFVAVSCWSCAGVYCITRSLQKCRRSDSQAFWCPACGEEQYYRESTESKLKSELEELQKKLANETKQKEWALQDKKYYERDAQKAKALAKGNHTRLRKLRARVKAGVCPCCHRTFQQLVRHMNTKHPKWTP